MREYQKKQKVQDAAVADGATLGKGASATMASTALATASSVVAPFLRRMVQGFNAQMYLNLVGNALKEPLPPIDMSELGKLTLAKYRDYSFQCRQKVLFKHL